MNEIKAIETVYNGYRFRSRLEARWAVFFDALGVEYEYEPEGFQLPDCGSYLPDFFLPRQNIYTEVKPNNAFSIEFKDGVVTFDNSAKKYAVFMKEMTDRGFGVWFVFGDPVDALLIDTKGDNHLFCKCTCLAKAINSETCICNGEEHNVSQCDYEDELASGRVVTFEEGAVIWTAADGFFSKSVPALSLLHIKQMNEKNTANGSRMHTKEWKTLVKKHVRHDLNTAKNQ